MKWESTLSQSWQGYEIPTIMVFELDERYLYPEKQILIEALENWLWGMGERNIP